MPDTVAPAAGSSLAPVSPAPAYDPRLVNEDLAPLKQQTWGTYNIFAFWMSDVHSVGGYVTAGSLFALGLRSWQVLVAQYSWFIGCAQALVGYRVLALRGPLRIDAARHVPSFENR